MAVFVSRNESSDRLLAGLLGAYVKLTLEIEASIPDGTPEQVVRVVAENSRTLNFDDSGFETE